MQTNYNKVLQIYTQKIYIKSKLINERNMLYYIFNKIYEF